jgi:predicted nuclease of predicted toxin-antitoxin system
MWLIDAKMPAQLVALLGELGIEADSAVARGWNTLSNGSIVSVAVQANFTTLLTRDRLFGESAARALKAHPEFGIVRVTLAGARDSALGGIPRSLANSADHPNARRDDRLAHAMRRTAAFSSRNISA